MKLITLLQWMVGLPFLIFGTIAVLCNWSLAIRKASAVKTGDEVAYESFVILLGPLSLCLGALIIPGSSTDPLWWLSWVVDPATYVLLARIWKRLLVRGDVIP